MKKWMVTYFESGVLKKQLVFINDLLHLQEDLSIANINEWDILKLEMLPLYPIEERQI